MGRPPSLESAVMRALWTGDGAMSVADVRRALDLQVAYTTVMTVLVRLHNKGRVARVKRGRAYLYRPEETWSEYEARRMAEILRSANDGELTLTRFVENLSETERDSLRRVVDEP